MSKKIPDKNPIPGNKKFGTDQEQPSPEAKKKGWERKQQAQKIMDKILELQDKSLEEIEELKQDVKEHPEEHTLIELKLVEYLSDKRNTIDFLDRHISKAPIQTENKHDGVLNITTTNYGDKRPS